MCEDEEDQEASEFDIESRNWKKLVENIKIMGFREGTIEGKDLTLQEGFNQGFSDGFKLGEHLGIIKGIINCPLELGITKNEKSEFTEKTLNDMTNESCILCSSVNTSQKSNQPYQMLLKNFEDFISSQQLQIDKVINNLKKSDFKLYFEN